MAGVVLSAVLSFFGSFVGLIGTQGKHGTEPFLEIFTFVAVVLVVVHVIAAGVGMFPVAMCMGARPYRASILGSGVCALITAVLFTGSMTVPELWRISSHLYFVLPAICGAVAIAFNMD